MEELRLPHRLTLNDRRSLNVTGVTEVVSFDEEAVVLRIGTDTLIVRGEGLHMKNLNLENGQAAVEGQVGALLYEEGRNPAGFWRRLWG